MAQAIEAPGERFTADNGESGTHGASHAMKFDLPAYTYDCACLNEPDHASYVFLLDEVDGVHPLPHNLYVALVRGQAEAPALAGQTLRLADWYVRLKDGEPNCVVNETYNFVRFDARGKVDWAASPSPHPHRRNAVAVPEDGALPTTAEHAAMKSILFGESVKSAT
ncbi:MAG: hypothetical protein H7315_20720 [Herminiimonas sp.]|nr:hypothetical protein [Herminiimonas sp.]